MKRRGHRKLTARKSSSYNRRNTKEYAAEEQLDEDELTVPDEGKWRTMTPYGLFAISDKDGAKHRFKRGDIATILPQHISPGDCIEPHEYWIGEILEIRADAGSEDSHVIWTKVRWFYNAEDAVGIVKSLDTSHIGKFERLFSSHWDYVLPHTFNEVISMPKLHPYPNLKRKQSFTKRPKLGFNKPKGDSDSISAATTSSGVGVKDGDEDEIGLENQIPIGPEMFYWRYNIDIIGKKIDPKPGLKTCLCSKPYSPDTISPLKGVMFFCPRPTCCTSFHVGCLRSAESVWVPDDQEVIVPTPSRPIRGRGGLQGKGKGKGKEKALDPDVVGGDNGNGEDIEWLTPRAMRRITCTPDASHPVDLLSLLSSPPPPSSTSRKTKQPPPPPPPPTQPPIIPLLQRVYTRQLQHHFHQLDPSQPQQPEAVTSSRKHLLSAASASVKSKRSSAFSTISTSGGSVIEVEDLLVAEDEDGDGGTSGRLQRNTSVSAGREGSGFQLATPKSTTKLRSSKSKINASGKDKDKNAGNKSKQVQIDFPSTTTASLPVKPLTPTTLLASLFLLPSPFPPSYASITSQPSKNTTTATSNTTHTTTPTSTSTKTTSNTSESKTDSKDLLLLASQPLLRGAGYIPYLGPTGNVSLVLAARRLIWEVLNAVGRVELSTSKSTTNAPTTDSTTLVTANTSTGAKKKRGRPSKGFTNRTNKTKAPPPTTPATNDDNEELDEAQQDIRDAEDFRKILECVHSLLNGWKQRFRNPTSASDEEGGEGGESKVLPPGGEVDDGLIVKRGLVIGDDELVGAVSRGGGFRGVGPGAGGGEDVEMVDGTGGEVEVEYPLRSGKKRKRMDDSVRQAGGSRGKSKGKERKGDGDEDVEMEGGGGKTLTEQEEEMLLRVDWACPSCEGSL